MTVSATPRAQLLDRYGRFYGAERLAIAFTASNHGEDAKRVTTKGWDKTAPLSTPEQAAAYLAGRGQTRNPVIVLRPSNLIIIECDSEEDLVAIQDLDLPKTITVQSSQAYKRHYWFRPPAELEAIPYVAFRFESGRITADSGRYFLAPPAIHPSGATYQFMEGHSPDDVDIAELPEHIYRQLVHEAREDDDSLRERISVDPEAKIKAGKRREMIFRYACMLRRWGLTEQQILEACQQFNTTRCLPPVEYHLVKVQVAGAMKMDGDQELAAAGGPDQTFRLDLITAAELCDEPDINTGQLLGPLILSGGRTIVVGDTGEGKTSLVMQMIRAVLDGNDFLDWNGPGSGRALIIDLEQGRRSVKRSLRENGLERRDDVDLALVPDGLALDRDTEHFTELDRVIGEGGYTIVALDPYYKAHRADEPNAERPIVDLMRMLDRLRADYGFSLLLPAHPRKQAPGSATIRHLTIHDIAGSGAIVRGAEVVIGIERIAVGVARLRFLKDREGDLPIGEAWSLIYSKSEGFRRDPKDLEPPKDYPAIVLEVLSTDRWMTAKEVKVAAKIGETAAEKALKTLLGKELVEYQQGPEGRQKTAQCYRLIGALTLLRHPKAPEAEAGKDVCGASVPSPSLEGTGRGTTHIPESPVPQKQEKAEADDYFNDNDIPF